MSRDARLYLNILAAIMVSTLVSILVALTLGRTLASLELGMLVSIASLVGYEVFHVGGNAALVVKPGGSALTIVLTSECIGIYSMIVYMLFTLSVTIAPLHERLRALCIGLPILYFANIVRILAALVAGLEGGSTAFHVVHEFGGTIMILVVTILWVDWVYRVTRYGKW